MASTQHQPETDRQGQNDELSSLRLQRAISPEQEPSPDLPLSKAATIDGRKVQLQRISKDGKGVKVFVDGVIAGRVWAESTQLFHSRGFPKTLNHLFGESRKKVGSWSLKAIEDLKLKDALGFENHGHQRLNYSSSNPVKFIPDRGDFFIKRTGGGWQDDPVKISVIKKAEGVTLIAEGPNVPAESSKREHRYEDFKEFDRGLTHFLNANVGRIGEKERPTARVESRALWNDLNLESSKSQEVKRVSVEYKDTETAVISFGDYKLQIKKVKPFLGVRHIEMSLYDARNPESDAFAKEPVYPVGALHLNTKVEGFLNNHAGRVDVGTRPLVTGAVNEIYGKLNLADTIRELNPAPSLPSLGRDKTNSILDLKKGQYEFDGMSKPASYLQIRNDKDGLYYCLSLVQVGTDLMYGKGAAARMGLFGAQRAEHLNLKNNPEVSVQKVSDQTWPKLRESLTPGSVVRFETLDPQRTGDPLTHIGFVRKDGNIVHLIGNKLCVDAPSDISHGYKPREIVTPNVSKLPKLGYAESRTEFEPGKTPDSIETDFTKAYGKLKNYGGGMIQEILYQLNRDKFEIVTAPGEGGKTEARAELKEKTKLRFPAEWK